MSCARNGNKVGVTAGLACGLSALGSKLGYTAGAMLATAHRLEMGLGQATAPLSNRLLQAVDRPAVLAARAAPALAVAAATVVVRAYLLTGPGRPPLVGAAATLRPPEEMARNRRLLQQAGRVVKTTGLVSAVAGSALAAGTRTGDKREVSQVRQSFIFKRRVKAEIWPSSATPWLNRLDQRGAHRFGQAVQSSQGDMIKVGAATWHRGTSVVQTAAGQRTISHLQSLKLPATHYYFDRPLSDEAAVGLISGHKDYRPHKLPGYVGRVDAAESLCPTWARAKQAMITSRLYWPEAGRAEG